MEIVLIVLVVIVIVLAIALVVMYNNLVQLRNRVDNAWAQVDVQLQRRLDLIPNLVETVKGYASHENATLTQVTEARSAVSNAASPLARMQADSMLTNALKSLFAVAEAYPDLKANSNFQQLQTELSATEDKISYMRQSYNDVVMIYNNAIQTFPGVAIRESLQRSRGEQDPEAAASLLDRSLEDATEIDGSLLLRMAPETMAAMLQLSQSDPLLMEYVARTLLLSSKYLYDAGEDERASGSRFWY